MRTLEARVAFGLSVFSQGEPTAFPSDSVRTPEAHETLSLSVFSQGEPTGLWPQIKGPVEHPSVVSGVAPAESHTLRSWG